MSTRKLVIAACEKGDLPQLKRVLEETELDVGSEPLGSEGETALHVACAHGHLDIVQYLVNDRGCSVAVPNSRAVGTTPLEVAWANKHWEVVEFLLKAIQGKELFAEVGLAPTTVTQLQEVAKYGDEALHQACIHGYLEVVKFLIYDYLYQMNEKGLNLKNEKDHSPTAVSSYGTTPLQVAWENKHWKVVSYLLQAMKEHHGQVLSLSPTAITELLEVAEFGEDAFHVACSRGVLEVVRYLHESLKCSMTQPNPQGETPLDIARSNGHLYVIHFLLESGECSAPDMTELHIACMGRDEEKVRNLASDIISLSIPDQYGITALHYATFQPENLGILVSIAEQRNMLSLLVVMDGRGNTPLHYAASCGCIKSVQILVSYYKSVNIQNSDGDTPLHLSIKSSYGNLGPVREILQHESCNASIVNAQNETALNTASQYGKLDSAEVLLSTGKCSPENIKEAIEVNLLLHQAVASNRLELVKTLLQVPGCNINGFNSDGETPLHVACRSGFEVFKLLTTDSRCDLNAQNKYGFTPLHITIASGQLEKYHLLITNVDCNPNIVCSDGNAPIHMMIEKDFGQSLSILLKHSKCNPNMRNNEGNSALHLAVRKCSLACATCLLQHDRVDPNIQNEIGNTPLHEAAITGTPIEIMESLIYHKIVNPNMKNNEGNSALHLAVRKCSVSSVRCLLQHDRVDPNIQNHNENTPLHDVVTTRAPNEIMQSLVQHKKCNPKIRNESGKTPLQIASESGLLQYVSIFILCEKYSEEELREAASRHRYIFHYVLSLNGINLVKMLQCILQCDINEVNQDGETPVHIACKQCSIEVVQVLVADKRRDLNVQNNTGDTALHIAVYSELDLALCSEQDAAEKVQCILQSERCNPNITNSEGYTPLHVAVERKKFQSAAILLKHPKCNPNFQHIHGNTALHMVIFNNTSLPNLQPLLSHKDIDLSIQNREGNTPLHEAVKRQVPVDVVEALILHKSCNPSIANNEGMTPLQISVTSCKLDYAEVLLTSGRCSQEDIMKTAETPLLLHQAVASNRLKLVVRLIDIQDYNMHRTNPAGETALHVACKTKSSNAILEKLVEDRRCDLNAQDNHGNTALHLAASSVSDDAKKVQCISRNDRCNPNRDDGHAPLHFAVIRKEVQSAEILLKHLKCNPNIQDLRGNTPLHIALTGNISLPNVQPLLNHKDNNLSIQNGEGNTPLHEAVRRQVPVDVVEALTLHKSCNPSIANNEGMTPLQISVTSHKLDYTDILIASGKCSHDDIMKTTEVTLLLHQAVASNRLNLVVRLMDIQDYNMHRTNPAGETALHVACKTKSSNAILEKLVEDRRCDLNAQDQHGNTALHLAASSVSDSAKKVQCITRSDRCNPNISNSDGHTPLHFAAIRKEVQSAEILLKHFKCNPNIQNLRGNTPLHMALTSNISLPNVQPLLNHKDIDLSIQNGEGNTPLHEAVKRQFPVDVVEALTLHKSCNSNIANNEGMTPLQISVTSGKLHYTDILIASGKCSYDDIVKATEGALLLHQAVSSNKPKLFVALLNIQELNMNGTNSAGETPLHVACKMRRSEAVVEKLVEDSRCDLNVQDQHGNTALHLVLHSASDSAEKVQCILQSERCNPNITNSEGYTPLHVAVKRKKFQSAAILLKHPKCNPNFQNIHGNTALHMAIFNNTSLPNLQHFLNHKDIDLNIQNREGNTPLHVAVIRQVPVNVVTALVLHSSCNSSIANAEGMTPLQIAVDSQQMETTTILIASKKCSHQDIVRVNKDAYLLSYAISSDNVELLTALIDAGVDINKSNSKGETALHAACKEGSIKATQLLLQSGADVLAVDCKGNAPIHVACANVNLECLSLILDHKRCNPNQQNAVGDTPLHIVCSYGWNCDIRMFRTLLSTPGINIECANHAGQIPAELAKSDYFVIGEISNYLKHKNTKLETYLKIFVVGNSGGGKSTLIKAVTTERSKSFRNSFKAKNVNPSEVPPHTAGIVPLSFNSKQFGHAVLYDFAGQHEYYSSHAAVMENLVLQSPPLFLLLIDISKPMEEIREELVYWWMFINNHSKRATAPPHVILVGSHKDTVKDRGGNVQKIMEKIIDIVRDIPVSFQFDHSRAFPLDCRKLVSQGLTALLAQLKLTCQTLRQTADIDLHCHILKAFLTTNFHSSIACKVSEIAEKTNPEDDLLPQVPSQLIPLLSTLSDKGYVLLLQNHTDVSKSWVVLQPEVLLTEVNGSIFAPDNFKEHYSGFAMSTGVVALSKIIEKFGESNNQVIIRYLTHLEFCFRIKDKHTLEMITKDETLQLTPHGHDRVEEYYFFPALVQKKNPSDVCQPQETIKYECGWFYRCNQPTEQLTTRFLHVLILRLAFSCDPPDEPTERESVVLLRSCSVWKHGIAWWTNDGIETIVEVGLQCRWVAVMLRCPDTHKVQCAELRTKVISTVLKTKQDFCPAITMKEFLIAPSSLQYPFEGREHTLYSMKEIANVVIAGKEFPKDTEGRSTIHISQLLPFEPFFNFGENLVDSLFTPGQRIMSPTKPNFIMMAKRCYEKLDDFKKALNPDQFAFQRECVKPDCTEVDRCVALFHIIQRRGCKTWRDFEEEFSRFSVFCGRNPMVSEHLMV